MKTIWKYNFDITPSKQIRMMPAGARLLSVADQHGLLAMWALVDTEAAQVERWFVVAGTGHPLIDIPSEGYVGSVIDGPYVWHLFELLSELSIRVGGGGMTLTGEESNQP